MTTTHGHNALQAGSMHVLRDYAALHDRWDAYVEPRATAVSDLWAWRKVLRETYGIESHFLAAEENGVFVGTLGLFEIRHFLFGHYLTTAVFSTDGGFHYDCEAARDLLVNAAMELADELGVDYLTIRNRGAEIPGLVQDSHFRTAVLDLQPGEAAVWAESLRAETRNQVRRGIKEGFTVRAGPDQLPHFHRVFHAHMRYLGSPAHSIRYYQNILKHLGDRAQFLVVWDGDTAVGAALLFHLNGVAMNYHTVALAAYNRRCPSYLLYWDMIRSSCLRGDRYFDMGRSEEGSTHLRFKQHWGATAVPLNYGYYLRKLGHVPRLDPNNPRYRLPIALWKRLPLPFTRALGPWLIRGIA